MNKKLAVFLVLLFVGLITAACQDAESTELNLLCVPQEEWCQGMKEEFEKEFGITVNYVRMSTGEALARLEAERDNPQFDIMWGGPSTPTSPARGQDMFVQYESPNVDNLLDKDKYLDPDNYWAGIYVGSLGFATNTGFSGSQSRSGSAHLLGRPAEA